MPETTPAVDKPKPAFLADAPVQWASKVCLNCHQWFDYVMRDRERQPIVCKTCAGD